MFRATPSSTFCDASSSLRWRSVKRVSWIVREISAVMAITDSSAKNRMTPMSSIAGSCTSTTSPMSVAT